MLLSSQYLFLQTFLFNVEKHSLQSWLHNDAVTDQSDLRRPSSLLFPIKDFDSLDISSPHK